MNWGVNKKSAALVSPKGSNQPPIMNVFALCLATSAAPLAETSQRVELPLVAEDAFPVDELARRVTQVRRTHASRT